MEEEIEIEKGKKGGRKGLREKERRNIEKGKRKR